MTFPSTCSSLQGSFQLTPFPLLFMQSSTKWYQKWYFDQLLEIFIHFTLIYPVLSKISPMMFMLVIEANFALYFQMNMSNASLHNCGHWYPSLLLSFNVFMWLSIKMITFSLSESWIYVYMTIIYCFKLQHLWIFG